MIDERCKELMNGEIDGVNSQEESADLEQYLTSHPEALAYWNKLKQLDRIIKEAKDLASPENLTEEILSSVHRREGQSMERSIASAMKQTF